MDAVEERALNHAAYERLKDTLAQVYERGRYVGISGGEVVADAEDFAKLRARLSSLGKDPNRALIVQAGVAYPESAVIFSLGEFV